MKYYFVSYSFMNHAYRHGFGNVYVRAIDGVLRIKEVTSWIQENVDMGLAFPDTIVILNIVPIDRETFLANCDDKETDR